MPTHNETYALEIRAAGSKRSLAKFEKDLHNFLFGLDTDVRLSFNTNFMKHALTEYKVREFARPLVESTSPVNE